MQAKDGSLALRIVGGGFLMWKSARLPLLSGKGRGGKMEWRRMLRATAAAVALAAFVAALAAGGVSAGSEGYKIGDKVQLYANKVGPFHNPSETYQYYDLPFCYPGDGVEHKTEDLGEVLEGDRMANSLYDLSFRVDRENQDLCTKTMNQKDLTKFRHAVENDYYFQMYYDDLPIYGFIGKMSQILQPNKREFRYYLFTHLHFDIKYNGNKVIEVTVSTDPSMAVDITDQEHEVQVKFTYSVKWKPTTIAYEKRMELLSHKDFLPLMEIHWFSIINSCVTVLLLTGFLATILMRVLKNDFVKFTREEDAEDGLEEEVGWKYIHGDVFRFPQQKSLLCAILGSGAQLFTLVLSVFILALIGVFYPYNRGAQYTAIVILYALTAGIAGYISSSFYKQLEGENWVRNVMLTAVLFCGPLLLMFMFLNTVAIAYRSTAALPFGTIVVIFFIWALVTFPLTVVGAIMGKNSKTDFNAPCRTTKFPREVPPLPWYRTTIPQMAMAGFLPFSAIYIELYYIFATVWGHKVYTIYSILFIVFIILIVVTAFITVALTYFQLAVEDHHWWWRSVLCGGSTAVYIYGYCLYYYHLRTDMTGFMQTSFFFGYMLCVCWGFFLLLGTVGFRAALLFVRHIYRAIKAE